MKKVKFSTLISLSLFCINASALNLLSTGQPLTESLYDNRTCNDLYMQASMLEQDSFHYKKNVYSDTRVASYTLAVFSPAIYYFGYTAFQNHKEQRRSQSASSKMELVRLRMAEKRCFERN